MKLRIILSALLMCAVLCACSKQESSQQEYYQIVTDPPTEAVETEPNGAQRYVKTAKEESFEAEEKSGAKEKATYKLPKITADSKDAEKINSEIIKKYEKDFETAQSQIDSGKALSVSELNYESYLTDIVLTIVITRTESDHTVSYSVYNYNVEKNKSLDNKGIAQYMKRDYYEIKSTVKSALEDDYVSKFKYENFKKDYYINYEKTLSDDNIENSSLFFDNSGSFCAICKEFASVGKGEFNVKIKVSLE